MTVEYELPIASLDRAAGAAAEHVRVVRVVLAVLRRLGPQFFEATIVPSALCYAGLLTVGLVWGVIAATVYACASIVVRMARRRRVSALLMVATVGLVVRLGVYLLSGNDFVYFVQPVVRGLAMAALFATSAIVRRPLVARFAGDFCSFSHDVGCRPGITTLFRRLTFLWAGAQLAIAGINLTLLLTVPVAVFIGTAAAAAWVVIGTCLVLTVGASVRTARNEGLHTVLASGGRLHAHVPPIAA